MAQRVAKSKQAEARVRFQQLRADLFRLCGTLYEALNDPVVGEELDKLDAHERSLLIEGARALEINCRALAERATRPDGPGYDLEAEASEST